MIENLKAAAEEAKAQIQPFQWEIDELGCFPNLKRPRVIWAGSEKESEETYRLYKSLEQALIPLGFEPEEKYIPHITLGRVKEGKRKQLEGLGALIFEERFSFSAEANAITLMESQLTPTGPIYKPIFRLDF
jgi:2'-5' RNA ligase